MKITLSIPYFNNSSFIRETLVYPISEDRISEIVICDDKSPDLEILKSMILEFNCDKIRLYENSENLGVFENKINALNKSSNEWVILFDSDNVLTKDYVDRIYEIDNLNNKNIYAPSYIQKISEEGFPLEYFDYRKFLGKIDKYNFFDHNINDSLFQTMMNTCNYFVNREEFLKIANKNISNYDTKLISSLDSITLLSDWIVAGNSIDLINGMSYKHRIHSNSSYLNNYNKIDGQVWTNILFKKIKESIKISICIPNFERKEILIDSFLDIIDDERISEIVIVDDNSKNFEFLYDDDIFRNKKVKILKNDVNLGTFFNKKRAVESSSNDYLILLDSDNKISKDYLDKIYEYSWSENEILCPEKLNHHKDNCWSENGIFIDYSELVNETIDYNFCRDSVRENKNNKLLILLNTGNYFVNKETYLKAFDINEFDRQVDITDVGFFNFLFLRSNTNNRLTVLKDLEYTHRVHNGSFYLNNSHYSNAQQEILKTKFLESI